MAVFATAQPSASSPPLPLQQMGTVPAAQHETYCNNSMFRVFFSLELLGLSFPGPAASTHGVPSVITTRERQQPCS